MKEENKRIKIFDTTLRDGEQSPGATMSINEKVIIAKQLEKLGVDIIEAGFPVSSKNDFIAIKKISQKVKKPIICALARCNKKDIKIAWDSIKNAKKPRIHVFVATSNIHLENKLKMNQEQVIQTIKENVSFAKKFCDDIEFSAEDSTRTEINFLTKAFETAIDNGATTINIADSVGFSQPKEFGELVKYFSKRKKFKNITISVHCHDDLGVSVANSLEGIKNGATQIECTVNGIGERAGNAAIEEIVMNINTRNDIYPFYTNIKTQEIINTSKLVSKITNFFVQKNKAIVGENAFAHEAGIHQHGVIANPKCYEIIDAEIVGAKTQCVIGRHSGKHAIINFMKENGIETNNESIKKAFQIIKNIEKNNNLEKEIISAFKGIENFKEVNK